MILHVVMWNIRTEVADEITQASIAAFKDAAENLIDVIPGIVMIEVHTKGFDSSNRELMLVSAHESIDALASYQAHPEHQKAAALIKDIVTDRACFDYEKSFD